MTDVDIGKVKRNVATMVQKGAPESDIDSYISQSGTTVDAVRDFKPVDQPRSFMESMSERAGEAMNEKPSGVASMIRDKVLGFDPITPLAKAAGVAASPLGAAGETLERKAGEAAGADPKRLERHARDTGDVSEALLNILPGGKVAKAGEAVESGIASTGKNIAEGARTMKEGYHARTPEVLAQATANMEKEADGTFKAMRESGVSLNPQLAKGLVKHMRSEVETMGVLNPRIHGDTLSILKQMDQDAQKGMSVDRMYQYRKLLRGAERKEYSSNPEGAKAARNAVDALDEAVEEFKAKGGSPEATKALQAMQNGISTWAKARKFDTVADAIERAKGDPNKIKTNLKKILDSKKLSRGMTKEEKAALKEASENSTPEGLLKMAGKLGFDLSSGSGAGNTLPFAGGLTAKILGASTPQTGAAIGAGTAARYGQKLLARGKAENLLKTIERGSPADEAIGAQTDPLASPPKRISQ